jgi:hypothetical protein
MKMRAVVIALLGTGLTCLPALADQWTAPTPEELHMTSQPEVPGAAAVYLFREETTEDSLHMWSHYVRLKVLSDEGKKYGDVTVHFMKSSGYQGVFDEANHMSVTDIQGRTIQPDGTIVPFTGKPFEKTVASNGGYKVATKVFSMPAVQVGSIIEYRYKVRWDDIFYMSPDWYPQEDLYTRKAHYLWKPTDKSLHSVSRGGRESYTSSIAWAPVLPVGTTVKEMRLPTGQEILELNIEKIKPMPQEDHMPPIANFSYRVNFYYTQYSSSDEFWKSEGKYWSKESDKFIGPGSAVQAFTHSAVAPGDTSEQKLRKLYAAVMELENTDYTRSRTSAEDRAAGMREIKNADDVLTRKRGSSDQLAALFVAMARSAGMKAYLMAVTNRERRMFNPGYLSTGQLDDNIAIVNVDGKEIYLDPGERYCPFGHLAWRHALTQGIRQAEGGGAVIAATPIEQYTFDRTARVATLKLASDGTVKGIVSLSFSGDPALLWRHSALRGDETSLKDDLKKALEEMMPAGMDVTVKSIDNATAYEQPFKVSYDVSGHIGNATSSRLLLPADIFLVNEKPTFVHEKRETAVYFNYAEMLQDAMRITYPAGYTLESSPQAVNTMFQKRAAYDLRVKADPGAITIWRNFTQGDILVEVKDYNELRGFYTKLESSDQNNIVLKAGGDSPASAGKSGN